MIHDHLWVKELKQLGAAWTEALAEAMPLYARLGYRHVFTHGVWNSVTSDDDPSAKGNICCPYDYAFAEKFGGPAGMRTEGTSSSLERSVASLALSRR